MKFTSENIEVFLAVFDKGSFSAAARSLKKVPSAISMNIANIEADLGLTLFTRTPQKVIPTDHAVALEPKARIIFDKIKQLNTYTYDLSTGLESILKIGVVSAVDNRKLLLSISKLSLKYPLLNVEIITAPKEDILQMLYSGKISFCLTNSTQHIKIEEYLQLIYLDTLIATISPKHTAFTSFSSEMYIEDLIDLRQIVVASNDLEISDLRPIVGATYWKTNDVYTAIDMVTLGLGWGNFPKSLVQSLIDQGELIQLKFRNTKNDLPFPIYIVWLKNNALHKAAQELIALIKEN